MDAQGRLTPEDGQRYIDFVERWGETPQGEKTTSCCVCGRCYQHAVTCSDDGLLHRDRINGPNDEHV